MTIRKITRSDKGELLTMMQVFYSSDAVHTDGSPEIFDADIEACLDDSNPYLEGYVFDEGGEILGYSMLAKSFSTEFGKPCIWIEDIYIKEEYRGRGIGAAMLDFASATYSNGAVLRLEAEEENERAVRLYRRHGFTAMPYLEMIKR